MTAALLLGSFNLIQAATTPATPWTAKVLTDGTNRGNPVPIEQQVQSWLQDGAVVVTQGYTNREVPVRLKLSADTLLGVGAAEQALFAEIGEPNTLSWTPNSALVVPVVFVVVTSKLDHLSESGWDNAEVEPRPSAKYQVTLTCEAFVRSATETVTAALPATGAATTLLDNCSSAAGWTGFVDGVSTAPGTTGTAVTLTATLAKGSHKYALQKTFAATTTSTKFLTVIWTPLVGKRNSTLSATGDGVDLPLLAEIPFGTAGLVKSYFYVAAASLAVTRVEWSGYADEPGSAALSIDNVDVTNINPIFGTGRQQARTLVVGGSARAPASLALESATAALGDTMVYVYDSDESTVAYSPPMRQFRLSGNTVTADGNQVSGSTEPLNATPVVFQVPVGLWPRDVYLLMARLKSAAGGVAAITYEGKTVVGSNGIGQVLKSVNVTTTTSFLNFALDEIPLPTVDFPLNSTAIMQLSLTTGVSPAVTYDEVWLFGQKTGNLIRVDCGTGAGTVGGSARRLFIKPATIATPRNTIRIGHTADGSDSFFPVGAVASWGFPRFKPPKVNVLAVTPNATDAALSMSNFNRWHTNPAS